MALKSPRATTTRPRLLLAVHTYANSYVHLPGHLAKGGFEVDLLARPGNPLLASRCVARRWRVPGTDAAFAHAITTRLTDEARTYDAFQLVDEPALTAFFSAPIDPRVAPFLPFTHPTLLAGIGCKHHFHAWCDAAALPTPLTRQISSWPDLADAVARFGFPCYVKGSTGSGGQTVRLLHTLSDLEASLPALANSGPWLAQQQIPGAPCGVLFAAHRGRLLGWFALHKRITLLDGRGPAILGEFCAPDGLEEICARACAVGGLEGIHGFDFMLDPDGRPLLIDPHLGRCTAMVHFGPRCGVDLGHAWSQALLGTVAPVQRPARTGHHVLKFPEIIQHFAEVGPHRALRQLHPYRRHLHVGFGRAREFPASSLSAAQILFTQARITAGRLRRRLFR